MERFNFISRFLSFMKESLMRRALFPLAAVVLTMSALAALGVANIIYMHEEWEIEDKTRLIANMVGSEMPISTAIPYILISIVIVVLASLIICGIIYFVIREFVRPIVDMTEAMYSVSAGKLDTPIPAVDREDELGAMASALSVFKENAVKIIRLSEERERLKLESERMNSAKSDFLANMSHEVRTHMNSILGMTRLILETELSPEQRSLADIVHKSGESLLNIANDILDFTRIESGQLVLEPVSFDLYVAMREITDLLVLKSHEKDIELIVQFDKGVPQFVIGDPGRIKQILFNLVGNAIKFTENGHVLVRFRSRENGGGKVRLFVDVEDTGIGISEARIKEILDKASHAEGASKRKPGGAGLGIAISSRIVGLMKGSLEIKSKVGKGSVFSFDIELLKGEEDQDLYQATSFNSNLQKCRVLVVENYLAARDVLCQTLVDYGLRCDATQSINEAREMVIAAAGVDDPYLFILVDYKIKDEDALAFGREMKFPAKFGDPIIILFSSYGRPPIMERLASKGVASFLVKPIYPDQLRAVMKILWNARQHAEMLPIVTRHTITKLLKEKELGRIEPIESFDGIHVLIVEDMPINLMLMTKILGGFGCSIDVASNGAEAVEMLRKFNYDVVFMDCQMPEMDGFEATHQVRQFEKTKNKHTIIIALTADAMAGDRERCLSAGMDDYLYKPFKPEQLAKMLRKWKK
ncbi:MAG: response regulator [Alphaproteobacteria bacterium]|nr:response regulator [Alphaproteobacteria bacterium]